VAEEMEDVIWWVGGRLMNEVSSRDYDANEILYSHSLTFI